MAAGRPTAASERRWLDGRRPRTRPGCTCRSRSSVGCRDARRHVELLEHRRAGHDVSRSSSSGSPSAVTNGSGRISEFSAGSYTTPLVEPVLGDREAGVERRQVRGRGRGELRRDRLDLQPPQERMIGVALHERPAERVQQHDRDALVLARERGDPRREVGESGHVARERTSVCASVTVSGSTWSSVAAPCRSRTPALTTPWTSWATSFASCGP